MWGWVKIVVTLRNEQASHSVKSHSTILKVCPHIYPLSKETKTNIHIKTCTLKNIDLQRLLLVKMWQERKLVGFNRHSSELPLNYNLTNPLIIG